MSLPPETTPGYVALNVADIGRAQAFYERVVGLRVIAPMGEGVRLGSADDGSPLIELISRPGGPPRPPRTTGLFHVALLVPSRQELALSLRRLAESRWPLVGASDHLVSEALYLNDPEGNGIEIYHDRPRELWRRTAGELEMATLPLDLDSLIAEPTGGDSGASLLDSRTRIGHVHLQVSDLTKVEDFYCGQLGFDVTVRSYPGALFLSAGGYHHHIGANTWGTADAPAPPPGSLGLSSFEVLLPSAEDLQRVRPRLGAEVSGQSCDEQDSLQVADPDGNRIRLATPSSVPDATEST